jgi:ElaB/YqjD/DUF883 family membrane-anchored ribosome-binding protein
MFQTDQWRDELQALKGELSRLLNTDSHGMVEAAKQRAEALGDQIKTVLDDLGEILSEDEQRIGEVISDRPVATLASAFALGLVAGFMLRRH